MDVQMPVLDGLAATERIRAAPPPHGAPRIVALTANVMVDDQAASARAGMDGFLAKPVQESELDAVLATAAATLPEHAAAAPPEKAAAAPPEDDTATPLRPYDAARAGLAADAARAASAAGTTVVRAAATAGTTESDHIRACVGDLAGTTPADRARLAGILHNFIDRLPDIVDRMEHAAATGDTRNLARLAHSLKGSSATLGADHFATRCAELESQAHQHPAHSAELLRELRIQAAEVSTLMRSLSAEFTRAA
jgi:HPt (histidine-containing phosphotransfer) domain-containing protein